MYHSNFSHNVGPHYMLEKFCVKHTAPITKDMIESMILKNNLPVTLQELLSLHRTKQLCGQMVDITSRQNGKSIRTGHSWRTVGTTVDGFIFVGTNFRGLNKNYTFVGFKIRGHGIFLHSSYRKSLFRGYWNSWIEPSTKTTKIGTPRKLSHPQYCLGQ